MKRQSLKDLMIVVSILLCATAGAFDEPIYTVTTSGEGTNDLDSAIVEVTQNGETTTANFSDLTLTGGTFRKRGTGWLQSSDAMSGFAGELVIEEGAFIVSKTGQAGVVDAEQSKYKTDWTGYAHIVVSNGATLAIDNTTSMPTLRQPVTLSGNGYKGLGAIYNCHTNNTGTHFYYSHVTLADDTTVCNGRASGRLGFGYCIMEMNGHTLTSKSLNGRAYHVLCGMQVKSPGHIILDGTRGYFSASKKWEGSAENTVVFTNGAYFQMYNFGGTVPWTFVNQVEGLGGYAGNAKPSWNMPEHNRWDGPINLEKSISFTGGEETHGMSMFGPVYGPGGITFKNHYLHMHSTSNTFKGGITIGSGGHFVAYGNGSIPAGGGTVTVKDGGEILFAEEGQMLDAIEYPAIDWTVSSGGIVSFPYSTNMIVRSLTKRGAGTLDLAGKISVTGVTEIAAGTLRIPFEQAGLCEGWVTTNGTGATAGSTNLGKLQYGATNRVVLGAELAYTTNSVLWQRSSPFPHWGYLLSYHGYIWNRGTTDATWVIAQSMWKGSYLYIDGVRCKGYGIPGQTSGSEVNYYHGGTPNDNKRIAFYTVNVAPGPHRIDMRTYTQSGSGTGRWGPCQYEPTNAVWKANFGWAIDWNGTMSTNCADYAEIRDPGDGSLFTVTTNGMDGVLSALVPRFEHLKFSGGTLDARGSSLSVKTLECGKGTVTNSNAYAANGTLTVGERLKVNGGNAGGTLRVNGKLAFEEGATLQAEDLALLKRGDYTLVTATDGIEGLPTFDGSAEGNRGWRFAKTTVDGVETLTFGWHLGTMLTVR